MSLFPPSSLLLDVRVTFRGDIRRMGGEGRRAGTLLAGIQHAAAAGE